MNTDLIAPLWDDHYIFAGSGQSITEKIDTGVYYSVTWDVSQFSNSSPTFTFQAAWFGSATQIDGFQFLPDDIVFSYATITPSFRDGDATIGINSASGSFTPLPGSVNGLITDSQANLIPANPNSAILFRPDGNGSYSATIIQLGAVPEPSSVVMLGLGAIGLVGLKVRKRRAA